ncbi:hypothetical protein BH09ACT8_BH09ACT8_27190 [soil metagenome]
MTEQYDNTSNTGPASTEPGETPVPGVTTLEEPQNGSEGQIDPNRSLVESRDRYRTERDTAREALTASEARIERMQRAEVERLAADGLSHPADLFSLSGNEVGDYLTESGEVDAAKVAADVAAVLAERPGLRRNAPAFDPSQGSGGRQPKGAPTFADLFTNN